MNMPNLFILGAPKCGTSTLYSWLNEHPSIYMSSIKEPNYFNDDHNIGLLSSFDEYLKLFSRAKSRHIYLGEASPYYLFSETAVKRIENTISDAKYVVMLRNPIEMFISLVGQNRKYNDEKKDIEYNEVWKNRDKSCGPGAPYRRYQQICSLGNQLKNLFDTVPNDRIFTIFLDDMIKDTDSVWRDLQIFLNIEFYELSAYSVHNVASEPRFSRFNDLIEYFGKFPSLRFNLGVLTFLKQINMVQSGRHKSTINDNFKLKLKALFEDDIKLIESLTQKDLSRW